MAGFAGIKAAVARMIPMLVRMVRDKCAYFQPNTIPEKTHFCC